MQKLVAERVELEFNKRLADYDLLIINRVNNTIDSAVEFSLDQAIEGRMLALGSAATRGQGLSMDDLGVSGCSPNPTPPPTTTPRNFTPSIGVNRTTAVVT